MRRNGRVTMVAITTFRFQFLFCVLVIFRKSDFGAEYGNRTRASCLGSKRTATVLIPLNLNVTTSLCYRLDVAVPVAELLGAVMMISFSPCRT